MFSSIGFYVLTFQTDTCIDNLRKMNLNHEIRDHLVQDLFTFFVYGCLHSSKYMHLMCAVPWRPEEGSDHLELELQEIGVPCGFQELNSGPSARATGALNPWAISPIP